MIPNLTISNQNGDASVPPVYSSFLLGDAVSFFLLGDSTSYLFLG